MDNFDIYKIVNFIINKTQTGNTFSPSEFQDVLNYNSLKLFTKRLGKPEEYTKQDKLSQQGYTYVTRLMMDLSDFLIVTPVTFTAGSYDRPSDMAYIIGGNYDNSGEWVNVEVINESEYILRRNSSLKPISVDYPVLRYKGGKLLIVPNNISSIDFTYIKYPVDAVFTTTTDVNGEVVYDSGSSTELEWNDNAKLDIIAMVLSDVGINLRAAEIKQYGQELRYG